MCSIGLVCSNTMNLETKSLVKAVFPGTCPSKCTVFHGEALSSILLVILYKHSKLLLIGS